MSVAIEPSRLPSLLLIIIGDVMEALDACGRIIWAKALAEPCCGAAGILNTLRLTSRPNSGVQQNFQKKEITLFINRSLLESNPSQIDVYSRYSR